MTGKLDTESVEAVIALTFAAGSAGVLVGYTAATHPDLAVGASTIAIGGSLFALIVGRVTDWVVAAGEIPRLGVQVSAPDNATTGFYATALAVMLVGLVVEVTTGAPNPLYLLLFVACGAVCFQRGFRRGVQHTPSTT
jgi:hypothetical protein